jgi:hypothetical protein
MIDKILDRISYQILKLLSAPELNTEPMSDLVSAYELFGREAKERDTIRQRQALFNSGTNLKARKRAGVVKEGRLSLTQLMNSM